MLIRKKTHAMVIAIALALASTPLAQATPRSWSNTDKIYALSIFTALGSCAGFFTSGILNWLDPCPRIEPHLKANLNTARANEHAKMAEVGPTRGATTVEQRNNLRVAMNNTNNAYQAYEEANSRLHTRYLAQANQHKNRMKTYTMIGAGLGVAFGCFLISSAPRTDI